MNKETNKTDILTGRVQVSLRDEYGVLTDPDSSYAQAGETLHYIVDSASGNILMHDAPGLKDQLFPGLTSGLKVAPNSNKQLEKLVAYRCQEIIPTYEVDEELVSKLKSIRREDRKPYMDICVRENEGIVTLYIKPYSLKKLRRVGGGLSIAIRELANYLHRYGVKLWVINYRDATAGLKAYLGPSLDIPIIPLPDEDDE